MILFRLRLAGIAALILWWAGGSCGGATGGGPAPRPARIATQYALTSAHDNNEADPADWRLLASNDDGQTWTELDRRSNELFSTRSERRVFELRNAVAYNVYRLHVSRSRPSGNRVELAELELIGPAVGWEDAGELKALINSFREHPLLGPAGRCI